MEEPFGRPLPPPVAADFEPYFVPPPVPRRDRVGLHVLLFLLTILTTTFVGGLHYRGFERGLDVTPPPAAQVEEVNSVAEFITSFARALVATLVALAALMTNASFIGNGLC